MKSIFARRFSGLRREKGSSQREAAADFGISQALLSHYENDAREPKLGFVVRACDYYGVSADYLLGRVSERTPQGLPAPHDCVGAPQLMSAAKAVFDTLDKLSDDDVYAAAVNFLVIPIENVARLLREPESRYEPSRDVEYKTAEANLLGLVRKRGGGVAADSN